MVLQVNYRSRSQRFIILLFLTLSGCVKPDLGEVPFFCNLGDPQCPDGYTCIEHGGYRVCAKEGYTPAPDTSIVGLDAGPAEDAFSWLDGTVLDGPVVDVYVPPDLYPTPDTGGTPQDAGLDADGPPPHLGCQSDQECTDPSAPCCCPFPGLPQFWTCLPMCLNPLCVAN
jgi:hypothetical protein